MKPSHKAGFPGIVLALLVTIAVAWTTEGGARGAWTFTSIDVPGAVATGGPLRFLEINEVGEVVGSYQAGTGTNTRTHAFLLGAAGFTSFDHPDATRSTFANSINPQGEIVGAYLGAVLHSYLLSGGTFTSVDPPGALVAVALGINPRGEIVGLYNATSASILAGSQGFLLRDGEFTSVDVPGATFTWAEAINAKGDIVGRFQSSDGTMHGFLQRRGAFSPIDVPNSFSTVAQDINARGEIVGTYQSSDGRSHGFLLRGRCRRRDHSAPGCSSDTALTSIDFPGAIDTHAFGINAQGDVVGAYLSGGTFHGFLLRR